MKLNLPELLCDQAVAFVNDLVEELERQDVIQELDKPLLELAGSIYHVYFISRKSVLTEGPTYKAKGYTGDVLIKANPNLKIMVDAQIQLMKIIGELGLSPRSRKQLSSLPISHLDTDSPLKEFFKTVEKRN